MTSKIFLGKFQNCKKSTQALSVYRKGTVCVYNECLIVALHKVTIERRCGKKVIVCCTSLSATWSSVMPLTRRHPLHHQRTRIYRKICKCRLLQCSKGWRMMAHCNEDWSLPLPKDSAWHAAQFITYGSRQHNLLTRVQFPEKNSRRPPIYPTEFVCEGVKDVLLRK